MDETPANVVESIVKDGAADVRAAGLIPRPNGLHKYVAGIVETMEKRDAEDRLRIKPKPVVEARPDVQRSTVQMETEYQKRLRRRGHEPLPGSWTVTRAPAKRERTLLMPDKRNAQAKVRMRARLRLLRSKPDWADRLKRINPLALQGQLGADKQKHAEFLVTEVIRASEAVFGPWWKAPAKKLHFT